jgi:hypothetical protein
VNYFGIATIACASLVLAGCNSTSASEATQLPSVAASTSAPTSPPGLVAPTATPAAPPASAPASTAVHVPECCWADLPAGWTVRGPSDSGLYQASGSDTGLAADFQGVGAATDCPSEPTLVAVELFGPSSQIHLESKKRLIINGVSVTAWLTAPNDLQTFPRYEYVDADVVVGSNCVDVGGAEYGVANYANLATILRIMVSVRPSG